MPIVVPKPGDVVDATTFGKPVADEVNRLGVIASFFYLKVSPQVSISGSNLVTYPQMEYDAAALFNGSVFTCKAGFAGLWIFTANVIYSSASTEKVNATMTQNKAGGGSRQIGWNELPNSNNITPISAETVGVTLVSVGDTVSVTSYTASAGVNIGGTWQCHISGGLIRPA